MPPKKKYDREDLIEASLKIIEREGKNALNARRLASELSCSVQPIFHNFKNMEDLTNEVNKIIYKLYSDTLISASKESDLPYKATGLAYINFAKLHSEFFKVIFMQETNMNADTFMASGGPIKDIIEAGQKLTHLSYEDQKEFHKKVWIFTHGIACLVATKTITIKDEEINELLSSTVLEMLEGYKKRKNNEKTFDNQKNV